MHGHEDKSAQYERLAGQLEALLQGETDVVANAANTAALVYEHVPDLNWAGFYFLRGDELVLGPFQGRVACVRIPVGRGVCGTAVSERRSIVVGNVHQFEGHIACDAASNAELVVPVFDRDTCVGVFDLDSPRPHRFDEVDREGIETIASIWTRSSELGSLVPGNA